MLRFPGARISRANKTSNYWCLFFVSFAVHRKMNTSALFLLHSIEENPSLSQAEVPFHQYGTSSYSLVGDRRERAPLVLGHANSSRQYRSVHLPRCRSSCGLGIISWRCFSNSVSCLAFTDTTEESHDALHAANTAQELLSAVRPLPRGLQKYLVTQVH